MGVVESITPAQGPAQGSTLGRKVEVCFHYDTDAKLYGIVVRDDAVEPWVTLIALGVGQHPLRYVLGTECQWRVV